MNPMTLSHWLTWLAGKNWTLKWFVYLVLFRPIIDTLWDFNIPAIGLSPLEIVGALGFFLIGFIFLTRQLPPVHRGHGMQLHWMGVWAYLVCFNTFYLFITHLGSMPWFGLCLKMVLPAFIYFYLLRVLMDQEDLDGILFAFLLSALVPFMIILYEILIHPISLHYSRGVERISGAYADVLTYSIYILMSFVVAGYFSITERFGRQWMNHYFPLMVWAFGAIALFHINHLASFFIHAILLIIYLFYRLRIEKSAQTVIPIILVVLSAYILYEQIEQQLSPIVEREWAVLAGDADIDRAFHGRMSRWKMMWSHFVNAPFVYQLAAPSLAEMRPISYMVTGSHNDYLRMLFLSGWVGLFAYLAHLARTFYYAWSSIRSIGFLTLSAISVLMLYSFSTVPSLYQPLIYTLFSIFAFVQNHFEKRHLYET